MRTVITHVKNEELLLPHWIRHHQLLFEHGIIIDYGSTDQTQEIARALAPNWRFVRSQNLDFNALDNDFEVMLYESQTPGWKIALTVTEFLSVRDLDGLLRHAAERKIFALNFPAFLLVDRLVDEDQPLRLDVPLVHQRYFGLDEPPQNGRFMLRRMLHCYKHGAYTPGRHASFRGVPALSQAGVITKFQWSPWGTKYLGRKTQIAKEVPKEDLVVGRGSHHLRSEEDLKAEINDMRKEARNLLDTPIYRAAVGSMRFSS